MSYRKRLERDLDRWIGKGLVPSGSRTAILSDIAPAGARWSASGAAAILGAVLLAFAAISFVAANWADLPRLARMAIIAGALWASFAGSALAFARNAPAIGHALALLGAALFGAAIALVAQTFNMSAFRNTGVFIWAVGALVAALAVPSRPVLILAALLGAFWAGLESANTLAPGIAWSYVPLWLATLVAAHRLGSTITMNVLAAGAVVWGAWVAATFAPGSLGDSERAAVFCLGAAAAAMLAAAFRDRDTQGAGAMATWFAAAALFAGSLLQSDELGGDSGAHFGLYAMIAGAPLAVFLLAALWRTLNGALAAGPAAGLALAGLAAFAAPPAFAALEGPSVFALEIAAGSSVFAAAAALVLVGARPGAGTAGALGIVLFVGQTLYVYARLFGDLLNTAAFFLMGGLVLLGVSLLVGRTARRLARDREASA